MVKVVRIEINAHSHATEDEKKVLRALASLLPKEIATNIPLKRDRLEGHYSNPIVRLTVSLTGEAALDFLRLLGEKLDDYDKEFLRSTLERRYDRKTGRLYLRLGKQEAFMGEARLAEGDDVIRVVIVFRGTPRLGEVEEFLKEMGLLA